MGYYWRPLAHSPCQLSALFAFYLGTALVMGSSFEMVALDDHSTPGTVTRVKAISLRGKCEAYRSYCMAGATAQPSTSAACRGKSMSLSTCLAQSTTSSPSSCRISFACTGSVMMPTVPTSRSGIFSLMCFAK